MPFLPLKMPPICVQPPCLPCSVALIAGEDQVLELVHNGCHDDHKANNSEVSLLLTPEENIKKLSFM